ncbi:MAG: succinate dehydrogenase flavoprotein subunit, partial [Pirellulales bacterium]
GLFAAPGIVHLVKGAKSLAADQPTALFAEAQARRQAEHERLLRRPSGGENPYLLHQELGVVMTKAATVVRHNHTLRAALEKVNELAQRMKHCSLSDTGNWTNQNVVFTKSLADMFPLAKAILLGAIARDECRGAHFKPEFAMPGLDVTDPAEKRRAAELWCDRFEANTARWLKSTIATLAGDGEVVLSYEDIDASLIPPRPRLYGLVGADVIEETWKQRQAGRPGVASTGSSGPPRTSAPKPATVH